ncbi:MAG TPA: YrdB family protein, partial [Anaerolineales bacterium]|nr:YrdB family protein [Anaerolineales bacterium]
TLISVGYWGFKAGPGSIFKIVFGMGLPLLVAVIWGMFGAPKSAYHLQGLPLFALEVLVFGSGVLALFLTNNNSLAWVFAFVILLNRSLMLVWSQ